MITPTSSEEEQEQAGEPEAARLSFSSGPRRWLSRLAVEEARTVQGGEQWDYNYRAATADALGLGVSALNLCFVLQRHVARGWLPPRAALACLVYVPHIAVLLLMIACRRRTYATWRKPLGSLATLHTAVNVRILATYAARPDYSSLHGGSPLRLLVSTLLPFSPPFWIGLFSMHGHLPLRWDGPALGLWTLLTASFGRSSCHALVADAGTHRPLDSLYFWSSSLLGAPLLPWGMPLAHGATDPLQQCLVLDGWLALALGLALPLLVHLRRRQAAQAANHAAPAPQAFHGIGWIYLAACALWAAAAGLVTLAQAIGLA